MSKKKALAKAQADFKRITLLFGGAGGAVPFIEMQAMIDALAVEADAGHEKARYMMIVLSQFAALCDVAAERTGVKL